MAPPGMNNRSERLESPITSSMIAVSPTKSTRSVCVGSCHSNRPHFVVLRNRVHDLDALGDLCEHGVDSVKRALRGVADEELTPTGVFPGVRHGEGSGYVLVDVLVGLALDGVPRSTRAHAPLPGLGVGV